MAAFTASQASVTNGSKVVTINSGESIANIRQGDFLFLAGFLVEINRGYVGAASQQYIELVKSWANSNQSSQPAVVIPTTGDFRAAVDAINNANKNVNDNFLAMQNWQTNMGTVTFTNQDGTTTTVKTLKQIETDNQTQMDAYHPYPWAMRKVEFEAIRAANNEKYAASGFVHKGKVSSYHDKVAEGLQVSKGGIASTVINGCLALGFTGNSSLQSGTSKENLPFLNVAGVIYGFDQYGVGERYGLVVKFPPAENGTRTYDTSTGVSVTHATPAIAFASEATTNKVVTDRIDQWGFESFLREINDADPFVYAKGLIQSQATNINGVTTVSDNVRPITYFAWYEGDTTSRGKGVNWQTATEAQRRVIASDPENNIYFDDATGKFYQWSPRGRSFAGAGNGDWPLVDSDVLHAGYNTYSRLKVQGITDDDTAFEDNSSFSHYRGYNGSNNNNPSVGCFTGHSNTANAKAVNGEVYFLVCGTVNRLNKGAYHPSLNPAGAARTAIAGVGHLAWNHPSNDKLNSVEDCFQPYDSVSWGYFGGSISVGTPVGNTGQGTGRSDNRYYDAVYASGQGGACRDMRYSAWGLTQEDFTEADSAIKSGEYRGNEKTKRVKLIGSQLDSKYTGINTSVYIDHSLAQFNALDNYSNVSGHIIVDSGEVLEVESVLPSGSNSLRCYLKYPSSSVFSTGHKFDVVLTQDKSSSVAGEYTHTEVIGTAANILLCDDLKEGWDGSYNPEIPDGAKDLFKLTRPYEGLGTDITRTLTIDNGITWSSGVISLSNLSENATQYSNMPANQVTVYQYKTKAKVVTRTSNSKVYGDLGRVWAASLGAKTWGWQLAYSAIGKILSNTLGAGHISRNFIVTDYNLRPITGVLDHTTNRESKHQPLTILGESNDVGFKALNYNLVEKQQGFINYAYTELKHNGTDWGDDSKIHISDNPTTMLDENGNTVLIGTARCVEPLGWIKNDK